MSNQALDELAQLEELHWQLSILGAIDVGIVVVDNAFQIQVWNAFMENHSGLRPSQVRGKSLFSCCSEIDESWLRRKTDVVWQLGSRAFITWQQRPYLFRFRHYRPVTGNSDWMYQNVTLLPLTSTRGDVTHLCFIIYDVSEQACSQLALQQQES
ncbi:PAS domain-containing protein [Idiomarina xiamenensis]|uniref:PAS domain-containing protein n=1 Tax=Idiomarina xiamenensis 10-D-4 TaxID=740709 RepID=K2KEW4_9GAMM|nr:PAS domain-containing protein [Idiomarina xiamenensis]EKE85257.1 PAS domain-containing protein [Idiomarina xiamenensis 10-D-4]